MAWMLRLKARRPARGSRKGIAAARFAPHISMKARQPRCVHPTQPPPHLRAGVGAAAHRRRQALQRQLHALQVLPVPHHAQRQREAAGAKRHLRPRVARHHVPQLLQCGAAVGPGDRSQGREVPGLPCQVWMHTSITETASSCSAAVTKQHTAASAAPAPDTPHNTPTRSPTVRRPPPRVEGGPPAGDTTVAPHPELLSTDCRTTTVPLGSPPTPGDAPPRPPSADARKWCGAPPAAATVCW